MHHTQLLNRLVREGKLTPVASAAGAAPRTITYHDPCFLGRHNQVYSPPRELLEIMPGAEFVEMPRNSERSFCCGAGGARMWMEETIGERVNVNRTKEAVATGADQIAVGCPFCRTMLDDGLTSEQADGNAREEVEVLDVAQMLLASVKGVVATRVRSGSSAAPASAVAPTVTEAAPAAPVAPAESTPASGGSLFDTPAPEAAPASGGSLFDTPAPEATPASSGSLFDTPAPEATPASSGSLFDTPAPEATPTSGGSLFDTPAPEAAPAEAKAAPAEAARPHRLRPHRLR